MENNKENKKGFWATLFAPKQKSSCCCGSQIEEVKEETSQSCGCGSASDDAADSSCCASAPTGEVKEVLVLGPGCSKCKEAFKVVERVIRENNVDVKLSKIEDIAEMMSYNVMATPAVVVDGKVKIKGHVPSEDEVKKILGIG